MLKLLVLSVIFGSGIIIATISVSFAPHIFFKKGFILISCFGAFGPMVGLPCCFGPVIRWCMPVGT